MQVQLAATEATSRRALFWQGHGARESNGDQDTHSDRDRNGVLAIGIVASVLTSRPVQYVLSCADPNRLMAPAPESLARGGSFQTVPLR